jgi:hypothetical protein
MVEYQHVLAVALILVESLYFETFRVPTTLDMIMHMNKLCW